MVLCALPAEFEAVEATLTDLEERELPGGALFEEGRLPGSQWTVAVGELGEGNVGAGVLAERAMNFFSPDLVLFVGVAGALKDDILVGDVVVATRVDAYAGGKAAEDFLARPQTWPAPFRMVQRARRVAGKKKWMPPELRRVDGAPPAVHLKPIAAGEVVLTSRDSPLYAHLRLHHNDAVAIEMEGVGLAQAAHLNDSLPALVIRGISDTTSPDKAELDAAGWQPRAAAHAASFATALLRALDPARLSGRAGADSAQVASGTGAGSGEERDSADDAAPSGTTSGSSEPVAADRRVVGVPPAGALKHWYDRETVRQKLVHRIRSREPITQVVGRRGVGKSGVVTRVLTAEQDAAHLVDDVVFLSTRTGVGEVRLGRIVHCLAGLLPSAEEERLLARWAGVGTAVLPDLFQSLRERTVVVVLDNLDDLQDKGTGMLLAEDLVAFLCAVVATPHPPIVITTSQLPLGVPPDLDVQLPKPVPVTDGLPDDEAVAMLRQLDDQQGSSVLAALDDVTLAGLARRVGGMPRGLQLISGYLRSRRARGVDRLLRMDQAPADVLDQLVCIAYDQLEGTSKEIIDVMAVAARPLGHDEVLELACVTEEDEFEDALDDLLGRQELVRDESEDIYRLHPLDTDHVQRSLPADRRAELHRRLADWYRGQAPPRQTWDHVPDADPTVREYKHLWAAGEHQQALEVLASVAEFLARRGAFGVLNQAISRGGHLSDTLPFRICRAFTEMYGGSQEQAEVDFHAAAALDPDSADWPTWRGSALRHMGRAAEAAEILAPVFIDDTAPRDIRLLAGLQYGLSLCYLRSVDEALRVAAQVTGLLTLGDPPGVRAFAADIRSLALILAGEYDEALSTADAALEDYRLGGVPDNVEYLRNVRGLALLRLRRQDEAVAALTDCQKTSHQLGQDRLEGLAGVNLAWALLLQGRAHEAAEAAREAAERLAASRTDGAEGASALARAATASDPALELRRATAALRANPDFHQATDEEIAEITALRGMR
ncbi:Nucleoside phosphorylase [Geodermatophilus sabuli]|uniref:Nucleoside phosphorylase n=1 Tax=Geodermatophilus sabuli TaxID=1564158 RepID=A0A285EES7_9ACTN|nr:Nucleoside phosphorylase [Geodermatophilus sabuli]